MAVDLNTRYCGLDFKNPIIVAAGAHGRDGDTMKEVSASGVAGVCTKTIVAQPAADVLPCFTRVRSGMINSVFGSDRSAEYWFGEGIKRAKQGQARVIANLAGFTPQQAAELAVKAEKAGADLIEIPTHCPHMGEILNAMFPGMNFPEPKLTDLEPMKQSVRFVKQAVKIPVIVKLSGTFSHIVPVWAEGVKEAGADGIACSDALGPALSIDIKTGQPTLGGPRGIGGLTGSGIMPITLRMVVEIAASADLPIVGVGGVSTAEDVLQYIMAGASLVGVCTAGHVNGIKRYTRIIEDLQRLLEDLGFDSPEQIRGLTLKRIEERKRKGLQAVTKPVVPTVLVENCNGCGNCEQVCVYGAAKLVDRLARIDSERCIGCGLCVSVCPVDALEQVYYA
jgi:dihydroorotate dehydrogenase subfamily 1